MSVPDNFALRVARCYLPFAAGYFLSYAFRVVNGAIAPDMTRELGLDSAALGAVTSAYFAAFAAAQLPMGVALDRWGPRRVEFTLLLFATAGAVIFALAGGVAGLALGRALIGFGVASCLIAAMKANTLYWPIERLPLANGLLMGFGGLGAGAATLPVELMLAATSWRFVLLAMAALTLLVALAIFFAAPRETPHPTGVTFGAQLRGIGKVLSASAFWRVAPATTATHAVYLSYQALWAGPWMRDVAGLDRFAVAQGLFMVNATMAIGYPLFGILADRLAARGISTRAIFAVFVVLFMVAQIPMAAGWTHNPLGFWALFGLTGCGTILGYAVATQSFPKEMAGRVGASINMLVFALAFVVQWGIGVALSHFPGAPADGHRAVMLGLIAMQGVGWLWLVLRRAKNQPQ